MLAIGDIIRFLNTTGGGRIVGFSGPNTALVEDADGFEMPTPISECVVVESAGTTGTGKTIGAKTAENTFGATASEKVFEKEIQTKDGDKIDLSIAYTLTNPSNIDFSDFDVYLINESNYSIYFQYLTKDDSGKHSLQYRGNVSPYSREKIFKLTRGLINQFDRKFLVRAIAFKLANSFTNKPMYEVTLSLDPKVLLKASSYKENPLIDIPAHLISIIKEDETSFFNMEESLEKLSAHQMQMQSDKQRSDGTNKKTPVKQSPPSILEIDLHANEVLETTSGMSNSDILNYQLGVFRDIMSKYYGKNGSQKIVFIHGKGNGSLRQALTKELSQKYPRAKYQDASFQEYGFGATLVFV